MFLARISPFLKFCERVKEGKNNTGYVYLLPEYELTYEVTFAPNLKDRGRKKEDKRERECMMRRGKGSIKEGERKRVGRDRERKRGNETGRGMAERDRKKGLAICTG